MSVSKSDTLLRRALLANALFSSSCGVFLALFSPAVAEFVGAGPHQIYLAVGVGLIGFAVAIGVLLRRERIHRFAALVISVADLGWVVGSAGLLVVLGSHFSLEGLVLIAVIAVVVLGFALAQLKGIQRLGSGEL